jgi:hypothetical protein
MIQLAGIDLGQRQEILYHWWLWKNGKLSFG